MKRTSSSSIVDFFERVNYDNNNNRKKKMKKIMIDYTDTIPDDLLHEIFIRLPYLGSSIRCATVCKRWSSIISRSDFTSTFTDHYRSKSPPLTLIFGDIANDPIRITSLPPLKTCAILDSFPWLNDLFTSHDDPTSTLTLLAVSQDLLLLKFSSHYYVCNPFTGQKLALPDPPVVEGQSPLLARCGLVSELGRYRVMLLFHPEDMSIKKAYMTVFCSEDRRWSPVINHYLLLSSLNCDVVTSNGRLYWLVSTRLIALRPFYPYEPSYSPERYEIIEYPDDFEVGLGTDDHAKTRLGLFKGQPRLSQLQRVDSHHLCLKVWDLKYDDGAKGSLVLESQVRIEALDSALSVVAFHPSHANKIFLLRDRDIYQYDTEKKEQQKVAEIRSDYDDIVL